MNLRVFWHFVALVLTALVGFGGHLQAAPASSANTAFETGIEAYRTGDVTAAVDAWTKASDGGHPVASYLLGQLYEQGHGVEKSPSLAFRYFERAAADGQPQAAVKVGLIYRDGNKQLDIKRNYEKAIENFEKGALQAWPESQFYLADMYRRGLGVPADRSESLRWLILAAKKRYAPAMLEMARIYFASEGVLADRIKGWSYIELASRYADPTEGPLVNVAMDKYTKRMKPGEKDAAKKTADEWATRYEMGR